MMSEDEGLRIVLSPVQLAAIIRNQTVNEGETLSNRLWGGLGVVGSVAEMFGAGVLCVVPEPTMITKAGCIVVGAHSLDSINASLKQLWTGKKTQTATAELSEIAAEKLGASQETAYKVGLTVDLSVPFGFAAMAGAVRIASVYAGRLNLLEHEGSALGHTIARHVGQTPEQLVARLSGPRAPTRASSFRTIKEAEQLISDVFIANRYRMENTVKHMVPESKLPLEHRFNSPVGIYIDKATNQVKNAYGVRVIIKARQYHNKLYFIVTAYPVP